MRRYGLLAIGLVIVVIVGLGIVLSVRAPGSTSATLAITSENTPEATADATTDMRVTLPSISADNLEGATLTFPTDFAADYNLVVMPFNRDQQTSAIAWLPTFQTLAAKYPTVDYYSIAALEDLSPIIRTLVVSGLNLGVSDPLVRARTVVLFLDNQQAFVDALGITDMDSLRVLVFDREGHLLHQTVGTFSETAGFQFQTVVDDLIAAAS